MHAIRGPPPLPPPATPSSSGCRNQPTLRHGCWRLAAPGICRHTRPRREARQAGEYCGKIHSGGQGTSDDEAREVICVGVDLGGPGAGRSTEASRRCARISARGGRKTSGIRWEGGGTVKVRRPVKFASSGHPEIVSPSESLSKPTQPNAHPPNSPDKQTPPPAIAQTQPKRHTGSQQSLPYSMAF
jgi:hypothetical protein